MSALGFRTFTQRFAMPHWRFYAFGFALLALVNYINLEIPQLAKDIINAMSIADGSSDSLQDHRRTALAIIGLGFAIILIRSLSRITVFWPGRKLESESKSYFFTRALNSTQGFFLQHGMGDLISRLSNDIGQLRAFYAFGLLQIANVAFLLVMTITKMMQVHASLTMLALVPLGLMVFITRFAMPRMHRSSRDNQDALGRLTNKVTEAFVNVHVIQANAAQAAFETRVERENEQVYATNMQLVFVRTFVFPLMTCLAGFSQLAILFYGGREVMAGRLTVGDILSFNVYIGLLTFPLTAMGIILALYQRAKTALERLNELESAPREHSFDAVSLASDKEQHRLDNSTASLLTVHDLSFTYPASKTPVLSGVSFQLPPGGRLGLFGPIGTGKSTLFQLITRLYDPPAGRIHLQGRDVLNYEPQELRRMAGFALQTVHLFSASIRENLTFGLGYEPSQDEIRDAAAGAQVLSEIEAFKDGWDTQIGEKGLRLSGGQKQRLALARLFLRKPPLLLLDDVMSAVDHSTETRLIDYIYGIGSALIISSHRGSALRRCDEILILDKGRVIDRGSYSELSSRYPELGYGQ